MNQSLKYPFLLAVALLFATGFPLAAQKNQSRTEQPKPAQRQMTKQRQAEIQRLALEQQQKPAERRQISRFQPMPQPQAPNRSAASSPSRKAEQAKRDAVSQKAASPVPMSTRIANARGTLSRSNPRSKKLASQRVKERVSENPMRFAFAPKETKTETYPWDNQPSAAAVMSTFLTGDISPELLAWHVNQRKKARYEKILAARGEMPAMPSRHSEYGDMLDRMQFSLAGRNRSENNLYRDNDGYYDPSNGSILAQLFTGHPNGEMRNWKEDQTALAQHVPQRVIPQLAAPFYPAPAEQLTVQAPQPNPNQAVSSYPQESTPIQMRQLAGVRNASVTGETAVRPPVMIANAEETRFVDDHFPAGRPHTSSNGIRQVSAEIRTQEPDVVKEGESLTQPGQIRLYSDSDENGWSPVE